MEFFMHLVIDILALITLLFFFLKGWHKGLLLSLLGVARVILSYGIAYVSGRYLGSWLGTLTHRPRLITIPICTILTFIIIAFVFHIIMYEIREHHKEKEKKEDFQLPVYSCLGGGIINFSGGTLSLILLFWLGDLFMVGLAATPIPGAEQSYFGRIARRTVYEAAYRFIPKKNNETQVAAMAEMISHPSDGMKSLEKVIAAPSIQQLLTDKQFAADLLSGDPKQIEQNTSLQVLFNDQATLNELRKLGLLSSESKKSQLCESMAQFGQNEKIKTSVENLKAKQLLDTDKILHLVRDPDFDIILGELFK